MYPKKNDTPNGNVASWEKADEDEVRIDWERLSDISTDFHADRTPSKTKVSIGNIDRDLFFFPQQLVTLREMTF